MVLATRHDSVAKPTAQPWTEEPGTLRECLRDSAAVEGVQALSDTHWGTLSIRVRDLDGGILVIEAAAG